ncbi:putative cardiolipin synthase YwiE [compost metagenome]
MGSINFDDRSFVLNDEINMSATDPGLITSLDDQFHKDLAQSEKMILYKWIKRPFIDRITEVASTLLRRQL